MLTSGAIQGISLFIFKSLWETKDEAYKLLSQRLSHSIFYASEEYKENFMLRHGFVRQEEFRPSVSLEDIYVSPRFIDRSGLVGQSKRPMLAYEEIDYLTNLNVVCDGFELSNQHSHLIVKGEQGIGKTTFLKKIGLEALSDQNNSKTTRRYIPVFIQISKQVNEDLEIKSMIDQEFKSCGFPEHEEFVDSALKKGRLLILIDELDAAPPDLQDKLLLQIKDFSDSYGMNRFIITCRTFKKTHILSRFHETLILGFDSHKIQQYIHKTLKNENITVYDRNEIWNSFTSKSKAIKYVIHNPFSLSIALSLYQDNEHRIVGQTFLYDKILSQMLSTDLSMRTLNDSLNSPENSFGMRLEILSEIAYLCLKSGRFKFHKMEFYRLYSAILEKHKIQQSLPSIDHFKEDKIFEFISVSDSSLCYFKNPMLQKLLVAYHLMENLKIQDEVIDKYFNDSDWKDVFIFLSGMQGADHLIEIVKPHLSKYIYTQRLSSFMASVNHLSKRVSLSQNSAVNRCYVSFMIFDIIFLFGNRQYEQKLISKILRKIRRIIELLEPESRFFLSAKSDFRNKPKLSNKSLIDPRILRGISLERLFDLALVLSKKTEEYGLIGVRESKALFSTINRLKSQLRNKPMSSYHRKICEDNIYRLWLRALKIDAQDLKFTIDELQSIFLYYQSICLIFCCIKEAFYISGRVSNKVEEIILRSRLVPESQPSDL